MLPTFDRAVKEFTDELAELLIRKRRDYGPGNLAEFGDFGILVRAGDKFTRLKTLLQSGQEPANEPIDDTWQDLAGYSILALMVRKFGHEDFRRLELGPRIEEAE
jgi:hypothetical protein